MTRRRLTLLAAVSALLSLLAAAPVAAQPAPTRLAVTGTSASATVTWQPVEGAVSYSVKRWKQDDLRCCNNAVADLTTTTWTDNGPTKEVRSRAFTFSR
ncbi:MAG: hypothetical protein M3068_07650 [Gemmatimonadota bacterium]|nr:hypothetical protein [Gemmatimonadota bacterium]